MTLPSYATAAELKAMFPNNQFSDTAYDAAFTQVLADASREVDSFLGRKPGSFAVDTATVRYFTWRSKWKPSELWVDEMAEVPTVLAMALGGVVDTVAGSGGTYTALVAADYWAWPDNAIEDGIPYSRLDLNTLNGSYSFWYKYPRGIKITCKWGFSTSANTPGEVKLATRIQAFRFFKRAQQGFADVGALTELGQLKYVKALDPDVANILKMEKFARSPI